MGLITCADWFLSPGAIALTYDGSTPTIIEVVGHLVTNIVGSTIAGSWGKLDTSWLCTSTFNVWNEHSELESPENNLQAKEKSQQNIHWSISHTAEKKTCIPERIQMHKHTLIDQ